MIMMSHLTTSDDPIKSKLLGTGCVDVTYGFFEKVLLAVLVTTATRSQNYHCLLPAHSWVTHESILNQMELSKSG